MVTPARSDFSMFDAALKTLIGTGSDIDCCGRSWMPSQLRWAWLFIMPGMIVLPCVSMISADPASGASTRLPTAAILPSATWTKPSSITSSELQGMTRP